MRGQICSTEDTRKNIWNEDNPRETRTGGNPDTHIPREHRRKWDPKSKPGIFVGYSEATKGYRIYDPHSEKIQVGRDVICKHKNEIDEEVLDEIDSTLKIPDVDTDTEEVLDEIDPTLNIPDVKSIRILKKY